MGSALLFLTNLSVMELITSGFDKTIVLEIFQRLQHAGLTACAGQVMDFAAYFEQRLKIVKLLAQLDPAIIDLNLWTDFLDQLLPTSI